MSRCHHRDSDDLSAGPIEALGPAELLVVAMLRAWVAGARAPGQPAPDWRDFASTAGLGPSATTGFERFMTILGAAMRRPLDVRCCACPLVGGDEVEVLEIVAATQAGARLEAMDRLAELMQEPAVPEALRAVHRFAAALDSTGLQLGERTDLPRPPLSLVSASLH